MTFLCCHDGKSTCSVYKMRNIFLGGMIIVDNLMDTLAIVTYIDRGCEPDPYDDGGPMSHWRNSCNHWVPGYDVTNERLSLQNIAGRRSGLTFTQLLSLIFSKKISDTKNVFILPISYDFSFRIFTFMLEWFFLHLLQLSRVINLFSWKSGTMKPMCLESIILVHLFSNDDPIRWIFQGWYVG